jgi:hypothetical protein
VLVRRMLKDLGDEGRTSVITNDHARATDAPRLAGQRARAAQRRGRGVRARHRGRGDRRRRDTWARSPRRPRSAPRGFGRRRGGRRDEGPPVPGRQARGAHALRARLLRRPSPTRRRATSRRWRGARGWSGRTCAPTCVATGSAPRATARAEPVRRPRPPRGLAEAHRNRTCPGQQNCPTPVLKTGGRRQPSERFRRPF